MRVRFHHFKVQTQALKPLSWYSVPANEALFVASQEVIGSFVTLLLAFDMDHRLDEAESLWNMFLHTRTRSIPKRLFSRMISLYDHHEMKNKIIEVFADMEELSVRPDEDTVRRVARAFQELGQEDKSKLGSTFTSRVKGLE
ncbi:hypothetical protein ACLB2K_032941 [Fragaria x ananassa]